MPDHHPGSQHDLHPARSAGQADLPRRTKPIPLLTTQLPFPELLLPATLLPALTASRSIYFPSHYNQYSKTIVTPSHPVLLLDASPKLKEQFGVGGEGNLSGGFGLGLAECPLDPFSYAEEAFAK